MYFIEICTEDEQLLFSCETKEDAVKIITKHMLESNWQSINFDILNRSEGG